MNLLIQGAIWDWLCWYPLAHLLQVNPVTPSLQGHCPDVLLQVFPVDPIGWQSQAANIKNKVSLNINLKFDCDKF